MDNLKAAILSILALTTGLTTFLSSDYLAKKWEEKDVAQIVSQMPKEQRAVFKDFKTWKEMTNAVEKDRPLIKLVEGEIEEAQIEINNKNYKKALNHTINANGYIEKLKYIQATKEAKELQARVLYLRKLLISKI